MIEIIKKQFNANMSSDEKLNRAREFLQILCLKIIHDKGFFKSMAFVGGTALRVLYDLRRFSEDLDFSVIKNKGYDFKIMIRELLNELKLNGLDVEDKTKTNKTVQSSFIRFSNLLEKLGLSSLRAQKLSIKIEADSNSPIGWKTENTLINKTYIFPILHFDLTSLYATKLHACFFRKFTKGRDFYDLLWYLTKKVKPNLTLLNNAIKQTEGKDLGLNKENFADFLFKSLDKVDFKAVKKDVEIFLEDKTELALLDKETIKRLARQI